VATTIRYLGLKDENLKQAGNILAAKYGPPLEDVRNRVESVPDSVPTLSETAVQNLKKGIDL
jgi:hypothetical protein